MWEFGGDIKRLAICIRRPRGTLESEGEGILGRFLERREGPEKTDRVPAEAGARRGKQRRIIGGYHGILARVVHSAALSNGAVIKTEAEETRETVQRTIELEKPRSFFDSRANFERENLQKCEKNIPTSPGTNENKRFAREPGMNVETCTLYFAGTARGPEKDRMSTQAYYKERLGFDPADTVAEHQREQRSQHGYEESLSKFKGQNANGFPEDGPGCNGEVGEHRAGNTQAFWGCWAMFIEAHDERDAIQKKTFTKWVNKHLKKADCHFTHKAVNCPVPKDLRFARRYGVRENLFLFGLFLLNRGRQIYTRRRVLCEAHKSAKLCERQQARNASEYTLAVDSKRSSTNNGQGASRKR
ncbi:hypothetical protein DBV15_01171 [Temnothorax longispinosus]|uniref:Uncharacterized protein n=1 Tax=Temnothorax longispinosus TaxID=300112 RepID=A0A4S2J9C0_9HYME|nr:hypothetical protein DBV15_01171 [Temnothorax longispinosus]